MNDMFEIRDRLKGIQAMLQDEITNESPRGRMARTHLALATTDRQIRWIDTFVSVRKQMVEWAGFEAWRREFLALLDEVSPGIKELLLARIQERLFVGRRSSSGPVTLNSPEGGVSAQGSALNPDGSASLVRAGQTEFR